MKSQFDAIVKVKKRLLDTAQMQLLQAKQKAQSLQIDIETILTNISNIQTPQSGNFSLIQQTHEKIRLLNMQKKELTNELTSIQSQIVTLKEEFKQANKEYEKMKYLKNKEEEELYKKLQKQEQNRLDEVSLQLFVRESNQ